MSENQNETSKVKLFYQWWGNGVSLGISGTKDRITQFANVLFNHSATESAPTFLSDNFCYVRTDFDRLERGLASYFVTEESFESRLEERENRKINYEEARFKARVIVNEVIKQENFLGSDNEIAQLPVVFTGINLNEL